MKNWEYNGTEKISSVTPTPAPENHRKLQNRILAVLSNVYLSSNVGDGESAMQSILFGAQLCGVE